MEQEQQTTTTETPAAQSDSRPQYADSDVFELEATYVINPKLTVHVYTSLAFDGKVYGLKHSYVQDEMLITEETFKQLVQELHL